MSEMMPARMITGEQIRGARAMLRLDQNQFSALTNLPLGTIRRMERTRGPIVAAEGVLEGVCGALEEAGIEFIDAGHYEGMGGPGLRLAGEPDIAAEVLDFEGAAEEIVDQEPTIPGRS